MKSALLIAFGVLLAAFAPAFISTPAQAKTMKECAAQWQEMKAAGQTGAMKYRDFSKQCMSGEAPAAAAPPPPQPEAASPPPAAEPGAKPSGGRAAMVSRMRALRRRVEDRQSRRQGAGGAEMAAILERVQQAQKGGGDVTPRVGSRPG